MHGLHMEWEGKFEAAYTGEVVLSYMGAWYYNGFCLWPQNMQW